MVDTGMNRAGVSPDQFDTLVRKIASLPSLRLAGVCTHFACGETPDHPFTTEQLTRFLALTDNHPAATQPLRHAASSGSLFWMPAAHLDMVRPASACTASTPSAGPRWTARSGRRIKWTAPLIGVRDVPAGHVRRLRADVHCRRPPPASASCPSGYADGYLRQFSNRGVMMIHGHRAPWSAG